jgi:S-adenosylmethionine/arginine decarboxylase-like enzyme
MASHHFLGSGALNEGLRRQVGAPADIVTVISSLVAEAHLTVVNAQFTRFPNDGLTIALVLAESHLVLHLWTEERRITIDLHICDYLASNQEKARRLVALLTRECFDPLVSASWSEFSLAHPELPGETSGARNHSLHAG